jgi:rhodanese-related sulfurtransferase
MAGAVAHTLREEKVILHLGETVKLIEGAGGKVTKVITDKREIDTDAVIVAVGVKPEVTLAKEAGLKLGETGAVLVDDRMRTSDPDIFAGGDCVENLHIITGEKVWVPLGSTANRHGRVIGDNLTGGDSAFPGIVGTGILRTLGLNAGSTGLTETRARELGYEPVACLAPSGDRSHFYPGGKMIIIKLVGDRNTGKLLGAQLVGPGDIVRRLDTIAATLTFGGTIDDLANMDLSYAPPFGTAIEAVAHAANILCNKRDGMAEATTSLELRRLLDTDKDVTIIDVRTQAELDSSGKIEDARYRHINMENLRGAVSKLPGEKPIIIICQVGQRSYEAACLLKAKGFKHATYVEGGMIVFQRIS